MNRTTGLALKMDYAYKFFGNPNKHNGIPWKNGEQSENDKSNKAMTVAVDHLTFEVSRGENFGVLAPDGGGRSSLNWPTIVLALVMIPGGL